MVNNILSVENINLSFNKNGSQIDLIKSSCIKVNEGELVVLLGLNGSGKSTLLRRLTHGSKIEDNIQINFNNKRVNNISDFMADIVSYVPQTDILDDDMGGRTVYSYIKSRVASCQKVDKEKINKLLQIFNITSIKHRQINKLSGGQRQLIKIIAGFAQDKKKIFIIDEPVNNLDKLNATKVSDYIHYYLSKHKDSAFLLVTHCRMFPNVDRAYEIKNKKINEINYNHMTCFGDTDSFGYYNKEEVNTWDIY